MVAVYVIGGRCGGVSMASLGGHVRYTLRQRVIEVWSNIPFLYMSSLCFSVIPDAFTIFTRILILLGVWCVSLEHR